MINKFIGIFCIFLIVLIPVSFAVTSQTVTEGSAGSPSGTLGTKSAYDNDNDGVCNDPREDYTKMEGFVGFTQIGCTVTTLGDLCSGTPEGENAYTLGDRSGCSESQLIGYSNYWSVHLGDMRPRTVEANWLTDQRQGIRVYQPINFIMNTEYLTEGERIQFRSASFRCDNGRGVILTSEASVPDVDSATQGDLSGGRIGLRLEREGVEYVEGDYGSVSTSDLNNSDLNSDLVIRLSQQSEELVRPKNILNYRHEYGIDEIEFTCRATINSCRERITEEDGERTTGRCSAIYPPEIDEFTVIVPIDSLALQAPGWFLDAGIDTADAIIGATEKMIPTLETIFSFVSTNCWRAVGIVLLGAGLSFFWGGFNDFAKFVWYGPERFKNIGIYKDSFILSGRSACAATVCPRTWCRFLNLRPFGCDKSFAELSKDASIQNSLILSTGCGCVSGLLINMYRLRAIAMDWRTCMLRAKTSGEFIGKCDQYLKEGICEFVIKEIETWDGFSFLSILSDAKEDNPQNKNVVNAQIEAGEAEGFRGRTDLAIQNVKTFGQELKTVGSSGGRGVLGYQDYSLARTMCSIAIYRRVPELSGIYSHDLDRINIESTTSSNFNYKVAYLGEGGRPVYAYEVYWMVVAGKETLRYRVYLENDAGAKRPIYDDILENVGDFNSDYIEITDDIEYTKLCFELPQEAQRIRCYPPGGGSSGGLLSDLDLFTDDTVPDRDGDRLPDDWEVRYDCNSARSNFVNPEDETNCKALIASGKENRLNPDNPDSDGNGEGDGSEDPDEDGYNNYQEYREDGHPNKASATLGGGTVQTNCYSQFSNFNFDSGSEITGINSVVRKFVPGEKVDIRLSDLRITGGTAGAGQILVKTEITGARLFSLLDETTYNDALSGVFTVWNIPTGGNAPSTGIYDVKVQLILPRSFGGGELCRNDAGKISEITKKILVYNREKGGCLDSDEGVNFNVDGVCVDVNGVNADGCNGNQALDYYCSGGNCVSSTQDCGNGGICSMGKCSKVCFDNDATNTIGTYGVCKYLDTSARTSTYVVKADECNQDKTKVIEYKCSNSNVCEQEIKECVPNTQCNTENIRINFAEADINKAYSVGICK
ncbi:MAG: hypothetical protein KKG75_04865 [Nanoarchaeota archaeon]|nr:hypothetical protein [Nanoarchaeota archaeon]